MSDNLAYTWRYHRLDDILRGSKLLDDLHRAGYYTAGDVLDVEAEQLAEDVYGIGPKLAVKIRDMVWEAIQPTYITPSMIEIDAWTEADPPKPTVIDALATICCFVAAVTLIYFTTRLLL